MDELEPIEDKSVFTESLQRAIASVTEEHKELSELEARKLAKPNMLMYELKQAWWTEFLYAQSKGQTMRVYKVYSGLCHKDHFYNRIIKSTDKMAWLIQPLATYDVKVRSALQKALDRVP